MQVDGRRQEFVDGNFAVQRISALQKKDADLAAAGVVYGGAPGEAELLEVLWAIVAADPAFHKLDKGQLWRAPVGATEMADEGGLYPLDLQLRHNGADLQGAAV